MTRKTAASKRFYRELGRRVRKLRDAAGLTQKQLGEALGVTMPFVSFIELGRTQLLGHMVPLLCDALHTNPTYLLTGVELGAVTVGHCDHDVIYGPPPRQPRMAPKDVPVLMTKKQVEALVREFSR